MKKLILFSLLFSLLLSTTCFAFGVDWNSNTISAIGIGSAPEYAVKPGQADALARRAAVVDAYRNLASIVYGVEIENHTTVEQLAVKKDTIKTSVSGVIKNARIVDEELLDNGNYQITLTMPVFGAHSLASAVWGSDQNAVMMPTPPMKDDTLLPVPLPPEKEATATGTFSGVVVDCRGLGLERTMAPNIIDTTGRVIYSSKDANNSTMIQNGLVSYAKTDDPVDLKYAGNKPIVVKATAIKDFNPVISKEDGDKILAANQEGHFFKVCSVVFLE
ncbi:MAG: hypothetical protein H6Q70_929 [Firmicutes bacterium]|nr:hypothetical protein [Bacillota bacterium]